jgi:DNA-binding transcriptional MerR regulator
MLTSHIHVKMGQYSIKELEKLSGIKAHTIRIWEKRHRLIAPDRTTTNIRLYSDEDLKKIINVSLLNNHGIKISKIVQMDDRQMAEKIMEISGKPNETEVFIDQLVVAMVDMEEEKFDQILSDISKRLGFERSITDVVYPFMEKIGILWQTGNITPAHEHFISNLIRQKLITSIAALPIPPKRAKVAILYLPEGELHELGLLFFHYITRNRGFRTYYLGQSVPHKDLKSVCEVHNPVVLITSLVSTPAPQLLDSYLRTLSNDFPSVTICASGLMLRNTAFHCPKNVKPFYKATELPALLDQAKRQNFV